MEKYTPPYKITNQIMKYITFIMEKIGKLTNYGDFDRFPILRKNNRIFSIHSSLAIEANSLSLNQVKDAIDGKLVIGEQKEIQEVKNIYKAYEEIDKVNPYNIKDLKRIHGIMTFLIENESGKFRSGEEGVFDGDKCIFMAPPQKMVDTCMRQLFEWMENEKNNVHPLILSSIFHYEFVFIHPFTDGNGRMARLWQNTLLSKWKSLFKYVPIESQIKKYQADYYDAIAKCHNTGESTDFIEFMLKMINETLEELIANSLIQINHTSEYLKKLLAIMEEGVFMSSNEILEKLGLKSKETLRKNYLNPAIELGLLELSYPDKPTSKNQRYRKK